MASLIKVRTISAATETAIQMANSCYARTILIGTTWNVLRVGLRWHMDNTGASLSTPEFAFGVCDGTTNIMGDASVDHFVGVRSSGLWSFQTTFYNNTSFQPAKKVGATVTTGTTLVQNASIACNCTVDPSPRGFIMVDITKGSPNFSFVLSHLNNQVGANVTASEFLQQMELATVTQTGYLTTASQTLAVSEAGDGFLDSVNVSWNRSTPVIEVTDIAVTRFS